MKELNIGITGVNPFDGNRGVGALSYSIVEILDRLGEEENVKFNFFFIINGMRLPRFCDLDINGNIKRVNILPLISIYRPNHFAKLLLNAKKLQDYAKLDYVLDAGYGDSYSDIYGINNFLSHNSIKRFMSLLGKKQMLLPQTIGPFFDKNVSKAAIKAMSHMQCLLARDKISYELVRQQVPSVESAEIIDMAFFMPYTPDKIKRNNCINVGIGISKMLWNQHLKDVMTYKDDYRALTRGIIDEFLKRDNVLIHLVPHVVCENNSGGNDYELSYNLCKEYDNDRINLSPFFLDPIKAKNYISALDFFTGARMHATIGAFSSGVPVYPLSYSRKFNGLFIDTLGYNYIGDMMTTANDKIIENMMNVFDNRTEIKEEIERINNIVVAEKYDLFKTHLRKFLNL